MPEYQDTLYRSGSMSRSKPSTRRGDPRSTTSSGRDSRTSKSSSRPETAAPVKEKEPRLFEMDSESFMSQPTVTLFIDRPKTLKCLICTESKLNFKGASKTNPRPRRSNDEDDEANDTVPLIFPCGHVMGSQCANTWLKDHDCCPVCRFDLRYPRCHQHHARLAQDQPLHESRVWEQNKGRALPRVVNQDTVHRLPPTVPQGGKLTKKCFECSITDLGEEAVVGFKRITKQLIQAREHYDLTKETAFKQEAEALVDMQRVHMKEAYEVPRETWSFYHW